MTHRWKPEKSAKAWLFRVAVGPCMIIDGLCHSATLGCFSVGVAMTASKHLALARMSATKNRK